MRILTMPEQKVVKPNKSRGVPKPKLVLPKVAIQLEKMLHHLATTGKFPEKKVGRPKREKKETPISSEQLC